MTPDQRERVHAAVDSSRDAQKFPPTVEDPAAISTVVAQLRGGAATPVNDAPNERLPAHATGEQSGEAKRGHLGTPPGRRPAGRAARG